MRTAGTSFGGSFRLLESRGLRFTDGGEVTVRVLKALAPGKWAVGVGGKVLAARSDVDLRTGGTLQARVSVDGRGVVSLHVGPRHPDPVAAFLAGEGFPDETRIRTLISAFLRHQRPLEPAVLRKSLRFLSRDAKGMDRSAAVLAVLDDKGWDAEAPATKAVMDLVEYGRDRRGFGQERKRGREREGTEGLRDAVRESLSGNAGETGPLQVFNHRKGSHGTWIVAPFRLHAGGREYRGTLRLFQDAVRATPVRMVLVVCSETGNEWSFSLPLAGGSRNLTVYCGPEAARRLTARGLGDLASDFRNLGVEVDDIIHGIEEFDGFSEVGEDVSLRGIDTMT